MSARKLSRNSGVYMFEFTNERKITLKQYKELALKANSQQDDNFETVETHFWEKIKSSSTRGKETVPIYAMDNNISHFSDGGTWNLNTFTDTLSIIHKGIKIPGVNSPYVNYGMKNCCFGIHCEDSNMASINILHEGDPRTWYSVGQSYSQKLENIVKTWTPRAFGCDLFIRHKSIIIPPEVLEAHHIEYAKVSI